MSLTKASNIAVWVLDLKSTNPKALYLIAHSVDFHLFFVAGRFRTTRTRSLSRQTNTVTHHRMERNRQNRQRNLPTSIRDPRKFRPRLAFCGGSIEKQIQRMLFFYRFQNCEILMSDRRKTLEKPHFFTQEICVWIAL